MKFQKLLLSLLVICLGSFDIYSANPFAKKPTAPADSDWNDDDNASPRRPTPKNPRYVPIDSDDEDAPQFQPAARPAAVATRAKSPVRATIAEPVPAPTSAPVAKAAPVTDQPLTLAERRALLEAANRAAEQKKAPSSMDQEPTLTVKERIALQNATAKKKEDDDKERIWKAQIDRDTALAKRERDRKAAALTSKEVAPAAAIPEVLTPAAVPSLAKAEAAVTAAEQKVNRDRATLIEKETQLAATAILNAQHELSKQSTPTRAEQFVQQLAAEEDEVIRRGQIEYGEQFWKAVVAQVERITLVTKAIELAIQ